MLAQDDTLAERSAEPAGAHGHGGSEGDASGVTMRTGLIVETDGRTWVPDPAELEVIDGKQFFTVNREDRAFARFLNLDLGTRNPWVGVLFIDHIRAGKPGTPAGVVDIEGAVAALRLADMLKPALLQTWQKGAPWVWTPPASA